MSQSDYKARAKKLIDSVGEHAADLPDILRQLEDIRQQCMDGISQEKVSVKDGVLIVIEKFPQVALQAVMGKLAVYKEISRLAELESVDPEVTVSIQLMALEDTL
ncbi:MAG: hypothetical protein KME59_21420 [Trichormus sp. ATA11-4-KO1]|jgi:hypothetical protein|nr:hypothetical protein [Trichormus sp. ATA11-4-KO1]